MGKNLHKQTLSQPHFKLKLRPGQEYQIKARESVIQSFRSSFASPSVPIVEPALQLDCLSEENIEVVPPPASLLYQFYSKLSSKEELLSPRNREAQRIKREIAKIKEDRMNRIKYKLVDKAVKEGIPQRDLAKVLTQSRKVEKNIYTSFGSKGVAEKSPDKEEEELTTTLKGKSCERSLSKSPSP